MKRIITVSMIIALSTIFHLSKAQNPTYTLTAKNVMFTSSTTMQLDIYMLHTNYPATTYIYGACQYFFDFNNAILNGDPGTATTCTYLASDLPTGLQPVNPNIGLAGSAYIIRMATNAFQPNNTFETSHTGEGTLVVRLKITKTVGTFDQSQPINLTWRNGPTNPFTKIIATIGGVQTNISTPATHSISNGCSLNLTALIEGRYNDVTNTMIGDTAKVELRNSTAPYAIVSSSTAILNANGNGTFNFTNAVNGVQYYVVVKHRNSVETWSSTPQTFASNSLTYDFTNAATKAYGSNLILKGAKWCIYSGDVDQDGTVDLSDVLLCYNGSSAFLSGYVLPDLNGDNTVDLSDILIAYNNSGKFVSAKKP